MTKEEKQLIYSILTKLIDDNTVLSPTERRDLLNQLYQTNCDINIDEILSATQNNRKLRIKRGSTSANNLYTGQAGEITMDTDTKTVRIHDGNTVGGIILAKQNEIPDIQNAILMLTPGKTSLDITIGASGSIYIPEQNGWIQSTSADSNGTWVRFTNLTRNTTMFSGWNGPATSIDTNIYAVAGDSILIEYKGNYTFKFILPAFFDNE